jgi:hypothetical protein
MAVEPNVVINLGAEFVGKKAFKQADTALTKLTGSAKKLAGVVGVAYGVKAIASYGKAAMKAAADDQKAQKILANNLKNVGLAYASVDAESFISSMEKQTAILDDQLRPAYSQLATVTGSATKTQELMQLAFDVSSGSGLDYASTVDILSKAYLGNTEGLKQLNLGLTKAELKSMDFAQIQTKLRQNFAGAGGTALDTYAGSMAKLSVATSNASETIGMALLDAIIKVSGSDGVDGLISKIDTLASAFASVVTQVGNAVAALTGNETRKAFSPGFIVSGGRAGSKTVAPTGAGNMAMSVQSQDLQKSALAARKKAELDAIKRNKELAALQKSQAKSAMEQLKAKQLSLAIDKANLALGKATSIFDIEAISLNAAQIGQTQALGKATSEAQLLAITGDIARLTVKQDILALEAAIASKDEAAILAATNKLNADLKILGTLQSQAVKLGDIEGILKSLNPKDLINLQNLDEALRKIKEMLALLALINTGGGKGPSTPNKPDDPLADLPIRPLLTGKESTAAIIEVADASAALANAIAEEIEARNAAAAKAFDDSILAKIVADAVSAQMEANRERYGSSGQGTQITILDKTSGLIEIVQDAVIQNNRYGNNLNFAGAIS